jgi:rare lipoprotein A
MLKKIPFSPIILISLSSLTLFACIGKDNAKPATTDTTPHLEVKSNCGNEPRYTINDDTYTVLDSALGYAKEATASWYGASYQGSQTAGCETFDMFAYTAAHRTLPLPSYVKITHKGNGKSVIVKVNDRGPFDSKHEIELSFAAANAIDMVKSKYAAVHIEALNAAQLNEVLPQTIDTGSTAIRKAGISPQKITHYAKTVDKSGEVFYVIVGTYPSNTEAVNMFGRLLSIGINQTEMATAFGDNQTFYMVRIGPLYGQDQIDNIKDRLTQDGLTSFKVVND